MIRTTRFHSAERSASRSRRRGVTLVEMIVATAICVVGMWLLTVMFQQATASFSLAQAQVTLTGQERMVTQIMTRDLQSDIFAENDRLPNRGRKLSDQRTDLLLVGGYTPPAGGYFLAYSGAASSAEPNDSYGFGSSRSTAHFIQFTAILQDTPGNRYFAEVPAGSGTTVASGAAEISYFLVPSAQRTPNGQPLYDLIRSQRLVALSSDEARDYDRIAINNGFANGDDVNEVVAAFNNTAPNGIKTQTLSDLTIPVGSPGSMRFAMPLNPVASRTARTMASKRYGEDRLMSNVLSFEVKFTGTAGQGAGVQWPTSFANGNTDFPYDTLPYDGKFDTFTTRIQPPAQWNDLNNTAPTNASGPMKPIRITGAQIRIRALHGTNTRQTTFTVAF